tara:strand:+ start:274 stop:687 length:414 start_codon:yes stop_codon:yes gene_type:complete
MNPTLRNILAVVSGLVVGSAVNLGLIMISGSIIPPPEGADVTTMEGLLAAIHLFELKHFIMPFLAHALGTFVGALMASLVTGSHKLKFALAIGGFFLIGGAMNVYLLPAPMWFNVTDLLLAYIPMAWLAWKLVSLKK